MLIIFFLFGQFGSVNKLQSVETTNKENKELKQVISLFGEDYPAILRTRLGVIATFFKYTHTERISLYKYESESFIMIGRFSHNPSFDRTGRGEYPSGQGCIDIAYREGKSVILDLPDPCSNSDEYYRQVEQKCNMPKKAMKKCNMKSRSYAAFALMDETGLNKSAVIMFESINENGLDPETLDHAMKGVDGQALVNLMRALRHMEPSVSLAKKMGL